MSGTLQTVDRALDVLEALVSAERAVGVTELAHRLGLAKANVHRVLSALERRGYVVQDPATSHYAPGVRCMELGSGAIFGQDLRTAASEPLHQLVATTKETVHLAIYDSGHAVYIDKLDSPHAVAPKSRVGLRAPATCVATGRVLLAFQPRYEIDHVLSGDLPTYTPETITDPESLQRLLESVRREGVATNRNSWRLGVCGIAAPIRDHSGVVVASVGCCAPESRFGELAVAHMREATLQAAEAVARALGYHPAPAAASGDCTASATSAIVPDGDTTAV